jgi:hypothetical protein
MSIISVLKGSASKGLGCNDLEEIDSTGLLSISLM